MKQAIAVVSKRFSAGCVASICICDDATSLFHLRTINGDEDSIDVKLYQIEEEVAFCNFTEGFIFDNHQKMEVNGKTFGCKWLCNLTRPK